MVQLATRPAEVGAHAAPRWRTSAGEYSILSGSSLIDHCEPHFHRTWILAVLRAGEARVHIRGAAQAWTAGEAFIANPYEIVAGGAVTAHLVYDVCYPCERFMAEALALSQGGDGVLPRLTPERLPDDRRAELADILADFGSCSVAARAEQRLLDFVRRAPELLHAEPLSRDAAAWVRSVCEIIEDEIEGGGAVHALAERLDCDRFQLVRLFRRVTGLPPSSYIRQLRLARALERLREGEAIADAAQACGFADQAHLTRSFKQLYGTTPGHLVRDLAATRRTAVQDTA